MHCLALIAIISVIGFGCAKSGGGSQSDDTNAADLSADDVELPENFLDIRLFQDSDPDDPSENVIPFEVAVPFYSDGADKKRYIVLPKDGVIGVDEDNKQFSFPTGTILAKHFRTAKGDNIETRLMVLKDDKTWRFATYIWTDEDVPQKSLTPKLVQVGGKSFRIPSEKECKQCHNAKLDEGPVLGFVPNQVAGMIDAIEKRVPGAFGHANKELKKITQVADPFDINVGLEFRARTYLGLNCSMCHQAKGVAKEKDMDLRADLDLGDTGLLDDSKIAPGQPSKSKVYNAMTSNDPDKRMPPVSMYKDEKGSKLIRQWIDSLKK